MKSVLIGGLGIGLIAASGLVYNTTNANANSECVLPPLDYPSVQTEDSFGTKAYDDLTVKAFEFWHQHQADACVMAGQRLTHKDMMGNAESVQVVENEWYGVQNVTLFDDNGEIKVMPVAEVDLAEVERQYAMGGLLDHGQMFPILIPDAAQ